MNGVIFEIAISTAFLIFFMLYVAKKIVTALNEIRDRLPEPPPKTITTPEK